MAYVRANIFYEREQWKKPVLLSVGFHGLLVVAILAWGFAMQSHSTANDGGIKQAEAKPVEKPPDDAVPIQGKVKPPKIEKPVQQAHVTPPPRPVPTPETAVPYGEGGPVSGPYGSVTTASYKGGFSFQNADFGGKYGW